MKQAGRGAQERELVLQTWFWTLPAIHAAAHPALSEDRLDGWKEEQEIAILTMGNQDWKIDLLGLC